MNTNARGMVFGDAKHLQEVNMISMTVRFEIDTDNPKVAYTILNTMLTRGWDEPWFRDKRVEYKGIIPQLTTKD